MSRFFDLIKPSPKWDERELRRWVAIDSPYRDARRFLEAHPALVDPRSIELIERAMQANANELEIVQILWVRRQIIADALGRDRETSQAIREAFVNRCGALALDLPPWLEQIFDRVAELPLAEEAAAGRLLSVRGALERARAEPVEPQAVEQIVLADLQLRLVDLVRATSHADETSHDEVIEANRSACALYLSSAYPIQYAIAQFSLGMTLASHPARPGYDPDYDGAIRAYTAGLACVTRDDAPELWAGMQKALATAYFKDATIAPEEKAARGIAAAEAALGVFTEDAFPEEWAALQVVLGNLYQARVAGGRRENLEVAITAYRDALRVFTEEKYPGDFAMTQNNLGAVLRERIAGDPIANAEYSVAAHFAALRVYTKERSPEDYAWTMLSLANVSLKRHALPTRINITSAINGYHEALTVWTRERYPEQYAMVQHNLGLAYADTLDDPYTNIERAIEAFRAALSVYTPERYPSDHAMAMGNLGNAYVKRKVGQRERNLREAIACFDVALRLHDPAHYPLEHRVHQLSKVWPSAELGDWSAVHSAYQAAFSIEEGQLRAETGEEARAALLREGRDTALRDGYALAKLGRNEDAAVAVERGRARGLAESFILDAADPERISDMNRRARFTEARERFMLARADLYSDERPIMSLNRVMFEWDQSDRSSLREAEAKRTIAFQTAQDALDNVIQEIHDANDPADFLLDTLDAAAILDIVQTCGPGHALVYFAATPWGGFAVGAFAANPHTGAGARIATLDLPDLTHDRLVDMTQSKVSEEILEVLGGFTYAQRASGLQGVELPAWGRGQPDATFRQRAQAIYDASISTGRPSTLSVAAQALLATPDLLEIVNRPLANLNAAERGALEATMNHRFLQAELQACLPKLASMAMRPLAAWLKKEGAISVTLIPCGLLEAYPLSAVPIADGSTFADTLPASIAPSSRALRFERPEDFARSGVYALGNPTGAAAPLPWSEAEALAVGKLARLRGLPGVSRVLDHATLTWLNAALARAAVVDASCHGRFDPLDFLRSSLQLSGGESLTLADLLGRPSRLKGLRLLILSACQTAIPDVRGQTDEVRSIASAAIQAGVCAVLAALWPVDDRATFILIVRFMQEWLPVMDRESPAFALARAQKWLRTATNHKLRAWQVASLVDLTHDELEETGAAPSQIAPWHRTFSTPTGESLKLPIRGGGIRFAVSEAERHLHEMANSRAAYEVPYADPIYWAGLQIVGW